MPTITGCPAPTIDPIHEPDGLRTITVEWPGTERAELYIAPAPLNQPACAAIVVGDTPPNPKCEYTIARSATRHPIFHTGKVPPTLTDAHRTSRWLKYDPHPSRSGCASRISRSVLPPPLPAPASPRAMSHPGHVRDADSTGALPHACTTPCRSSTHPPGDPTGATLQATRESASSVPRARPLTAGAPPNGWIPPE